MQRFLRHVNKTESCWLWTASSRGAGYGAFKYEGKVYDAHRFAWFLETGQWPTYWVLHRCNNKSCVRFSHLYEGTPRENYADMQRAGNAYQPLKTYSSRQEQKRASFRRWYEKIKNEPNRERYNKWRATQRKVVLP